MLRHTLDEPGVSMSERIDCYASCEIEVFAILGVPDIGAGSAGEDERRSGVDAKEDALGAGYVV